MSEQNQHDTAADAAPLAHPVVMLGLDACEIELLDKFVDSGKMPHLKALRERGYTGRVRTQPQQFLSIVWTTMFTSTPVGDHGWYFNKQWRKDNQRIEETHPSWLPLKPFWDDLAKKRRLALFDIPYVVELPEGDQHHVVTGWQCHDDFGKRIKPHTYKAYLRQKFGSSTMRAECFGPQTAKTLLATRSETLETTDQFGDIVCDLLKNFDHDLVFAVLGSVHRGTHYLWDTSQIDTTDVDSTEHALLDDALEAFYRNLDELIGKVVDALPPQSRLLLFALHGMGPNPGWYEYLPRIVDRIHNGDSQQLPSKQGIVYRIKKMLPWQWVRLITMNIPHSWNRALIPLWSSRMYDWKNTRYFVLPMDYNGYIRLNIKGRDAQGCIDPADVDDVIASLEEGLKSFRDIETGQAIVSKVERVEQVLSGSMSARDNLPDLIVTWAVDYPTALSSGVRSDRFGEIRWPLGEKLRSGRSGNHTPRGWFLATGPGIRSGTCQREIDSVDIAPTMLQWMGEFPNTRFQGKVVDEIRVKSS